MITVSREDELRLGVTEDIDQEGEGVDGALTAGADHRHQDPLCLSAQPRAVAAPDLAVNHGRTNSLPCPFRKRPPFDVSCRDPHTANRTDACNICSDDGEIMKCL